jgi:4-alpha-glucanotransferase
MSPELLIEDGWLEDDDLPDFQELDENRVDYLKAGAFKEKILQKVYDSFISRGVTDEYWGFCDKNAHWLDDFSLFVALKSHLKGMPWAQWPVDFRDRDPDSLNWAKKEFQELIKRVKVHQYFLFQQWFRLKQYCNDKGIKIFGDLPIYVVLDSADVWVHSKLFNLDDDKKPITVAGVPPDYFSETGQLWGNPVYRWDVLQERGYDWWLKRMRHNLELFDLLRIDHFRGFVSYWEVPAGEENAVNGRWIEAPAWDFFDRISKEFHEPQIIAEDLGIITPDVVEVRRHFNFPGMKILLFAFGDDLPTNPYAPHNLEKDCIVYTGTHDNNTAKGWFSNETTPEMRERIFRYLGRDVTGDSIGVELVRLAMMSVADTAIFPLQDLLGLGEEARMNLPASQKGNWEWRLAPHLLNSSVLAKLKGLTEIYARDSKD